MWFFKRKQSKDLADQDRMACLLAGRIMSWLRKASDRLNQKANRYSKATQLRWFRLGCALAALSLVCSVFLTSKTSSLPLIQSSFYPAHIGQRSEAPPKPQQLKSTDSLTHQK